jgi:hypothetical protein
MTDRHTLSKAYQDSQDLLRAQATRPHAEPTSDVEVTRNAKGDWQFKVAVTDHDPNEAYRKAKELAAALDQELPFPSSNGVTPEPTAEDEKNRAANQALRGRIAASKGKAK